MHQRPSFGLKTLSWLQRTPDSISAAPIVLILYNRNCLFELKLALCGAISSMAGGVGGFEWYGLGWILRDMALRDACRIDWRARGTVMISLIALWERRDIVRPLRWEPNFAVGLFLISFILRHKRIRSCMGIVLHVIFCGAYSISAAPIVLILYNSINSYTLLLVKKYSTSDSIDKSQSLNHNSTDFRPIFLSIFYRIFLPQFSYYRLILVSSQFSKTRANFPSLYNSTYDMNLRKE